MNLIYNKVRKLASKKGVSIAKLEKRNHLSSGSISKWNVSKPSAESLLKVALYLGTTVEELLDKDKEE